MKKSKLPNKLSELIRVAIRDVKKVEKQKNKYMLNMDYWHKPEALYYNDTDLWINTGKCQVCLAGSVMACTLKVNHTKEVMPEDCGEEEKLQAIDQIRVGGIELVDEYGADFKMPFWFKNTQEVIEKVNTLIKKHYNKTTGHAPWNIYLKTADILEKAGL